MHPSYNLQRRLVRWNVILRTIIVVHCGEAHDVEVQILLNIVLRRVGNLRHNNGMSNLDGAR